MVLSVLFLRYLRDFCDIEIEFLHLKWPCSILEMRKSISESRKSLLSLFLGEVGGPKGPEPTRYGDWERKGRVSDF